MKPLPDVTLEAPAQHSATPTGTGAGRRSQSGWLSRTAADVSAMVVPPDV